MNTTTGISDIVIRAFVLRGMMPVGTIAVAELLDEAQLAYNEGALSDEDYMLVMEALEGLI